MYYMLYCNHTMHSIVQYTILPYTSTFRHIRSTVFNIVVYTIDIVAEALGPGILKCKELSENCWFWVFRAAE